MKEMLILGGWQLKLLKSLEIPQLKIAVYNDNVHYEAADWRLMIRKWLSALSEVAKDIFFTSIIT